MKIHALFYEKLESITGTHAEGIVRGIERGHDREFESKIALSSLADIQKTIKELERVEFEFDVHDRINVPQDLKWMSVAAAALSELVTKRSAHDEDVVRACIFHDALFTKIDEVRDWAKKFKDA
jgi:hypothetical protein